ncbi:head GIN domain-containing protein [Hufsiella ginkgonis]|uniref:Putative auto-transporter adhesin head GIN domain-containing protein n=1 Tax=Hufsiella ginkgonis TaxID=2695274 RepID=A0A7K1XZE9_9SPHI|nr:head GIN domain-containing protein [Hufsiella ginkgonis]MXV16187.1 hypothetical protein [Hufsiella ginkgonis]
MKRSSLFALLSAVTLVPAWQGCQVKCVTGSGNAVTETRALETFTKIEASGTYKLVLKQDSVQQVTVTADDNIQQYTRLHVTGNKLVVDTDGNFCDTSPVVITISAKVFEGLEISGAVEVSGESVIRTTDFNMKLSGANKVRLNLDASEVKTSSTGSSTLKLTGQAGSHQLDVMGAADVNATDFVVGNYDIKSAGASKCRINVLSKLDVNSAGASVIEYKGNPATVNNHDSGTSSLKKIQ